MPHNYSEVTFAATKSFAKKADITSTKTHEAQATL
jgi:hypothetical protein